MSKFKKFYLLYKIYLGYTELRLQFLGLQLSNLFLKLILVENNLMKNDKKWFINFDKNYNTTPSFMQNLDLISEKILKNTLYVSL